jgi:hypothetical protein
VTMDNQWYEVVDGESLQQGDFIDSCPVFIPEYPVNLSPVEGTVASVIHGTWVTYDVVVMNQSCDLRKDRLKFVLVCPHWSLEELVMANRELGSKKIQEEIRRGHRPNYYMLNSCDLMEKKHSIQIVDFRSVYTVPYDFLIGFAADQGKRVRLISPYREKLSQAFGNFFSRVGLPADIPSFR